MISDKLPRSYRPATECVYTTESFSHNASSVPIYQSATFKQTSATEGGEYDYTRSGNPTRSFLETHLSKLMHSHRSYAVSSGMSCLDIITRLSSTGQEIIAGDDIYGGTNRLLTYLSKQNNIKIHYVDTTNLQQIYEKLNDKTSIVLLESPTNPLFKIADMRSISHWIKSKFPNTLIVVDNTMMSPYLQKPLMLGADIVYHSGTKYLCGHHDVMAGVIGVSNADLADKIYFMINSTGCGLSPFDCFLLIRGIKTLSVRMEKQQSNAILIASFLESFGFKVRYPGLKSHPQYKLHESMSSGAVLSFETGDAKKSELIVESTKLFAISVSFGCVNSLISMPFEMSHASIPEQVRIERKLPHDMIRLCIGIEDVDDLIDDLRQALFSAGYHTTLN